MTSCDVERQCSKSDRGELHNLPSSCGSRLDDYGFAIHAGACSFYIVIEEWRERMPIEGGMFIRPLVAPRGYAPPQPCKVGA